MNTLLTNSEILPQQCSYIPETIQTEWDEDRKVFLAAAIVIAASLLTQQRTLSSAPNHTVTHNPSVSSLHFLFHSKFLIRDISALPEILMILYLVFKERIQIQRIFLSSPDTKDEI
jgi:hypothetical protein